MSINFFGEPDCNQEESPFSFKIALDAISLSHADREPVKILVMGSRQSVNQIVYQLHQLRFAEFSEWSRLLPAPVPGEVMRILMRYVAREPVSPKPDSRK